MINSFEERLILLQKDVEALINQYFKEKSELKPKKTRRTKTTKVQAINLSDYLFLPQHDIYVAKERTLQGKDWYKTQAAVHRQNARMLTLREFTDFLLLLKSGDAEDGLGNKVSKSDLNTIYNDITEKRDPWRAEWLGAGFKVDNDVLYINYEHKFVNKKLVPQKSELLETCVMQNIKVELSSFNEQGMPTKEGTDFNYWYPVDGRVAGFDADVDWTSLNCDSDPLFSDAGLGVRLARKKV